MPRSYPLLPKRSWRKIEIAAKKAAAIPAVA
jgi:hypothetical protein